MTSFLEIILGVSILLFSINLIRWRKIFRKIKKSKS